MGCKFSYVLAPLGLLAPLFSKEKIMVSPFSHNQTRPVAICIVNVLNHLSKTLGVYLTTSVQARLSFICSVGGTENFRSSFCILSFFNICVHTVENAFDQFSRFPIPKFSCFSELRVEISLGDFFS